MVAAPDGGYPLPPLRGSPGPAPRAPMDLQKLKIDRSRAQPRRRRGGKLAWLVPLALLAGAAWVFRTPLGRALDRLRLPLVEVALAQEVDALSAAAVSGTAANGYVVARNRAALSADAPGRIVALFVEEGSVVEKGEVVARLYYEELEAALRSFEAQVLAAEASVVSAAARLAQVERNVPVLEARVTAAEARLKRAAAGVELAGRELERVRELEAKDVQSERALDQAETAARQGEADHGAARADLTAARASLEQGRASVDTEEAVLAEARAQVPATRALCDQAAAALDKTYVRAPFDGVVVLKDAEVGEVVSPNSQGSSSRGSVATMVDFASLEVQVELPETSIAAVSVGAPARVFLDAYPAAPYEGRVQRIWPTANRQKATIEVRVGFDSPDERLRPEMGVRVVFHPGAGSAPQGEQDPQAAALRGVLVPEAAVVREEGRAGVFVLERDVARWRPVQLGPRRGGRANIASGVQPGELVVLSPPPDLDDGDRVRYER